MHPALLKLGNRLYEHAYGLYKPLYGFYKAVSDRAERDMLRDLIKPGMTAIDVGANIGTYTRFLAELVGDAGRIIAFEPHPRNYERLVLNVAALPNVQGRASERQVPEHRAAKGRSLA